MEIWKEIKDYESLYQVSDLGRIKALKKEIKFADGRVRTYPEKILKARIDPKGYCFISLYRNKIAEQLRIHRLVAEAFIPNPENRPCVNHIDSNRVNNILTNLEWATHKENTAHGIKQGRILSPGKKISIEEVIEIRNIWNKKLISQQVIGVQYGLGQAQISRIVNNLNWK